MTTGPSNDIMAFPFKDPEFGLQPGMTLFDYLAAHAPVTFEMALKTWGDDNVNLTDDGNMKAFCAVWAYLRYQYAAAMIDEREARIGSR